MEERRIRTIAELIGENDALRAEVAELRVETSTDFKTGVLNDRGFYKALEIVMANASRHKYDLSVALTDLDDFKKYNKKLGHVKGGDRVLREFSAALVDNLRLTDIVGEYNVLEVGAVGRYGGDEFGIILPNTNQRDTLKFFKRLLKKRNLPRVSFTCGIAQYDPDKHPDAEALIGNASEILIGGKEKGKGKVYIMVNDEVQAPDQ